ncbi:MAG: hypothetical protein ACYC1P_11585 [Gaiellaceae bacterium]
MATIVVLLASLSLVAPETGWGKEQQSGRVCGSSACRPVPAHAVWRLVPWYGFALSTPRAQPFFTVELRAGSRPDGRVVWAPGAGLVWTDARQGALPAWTRPATSLRSELERWTRGLRPHPPAEDWRPAPRVAPVTVVKACGPRGCRGVGEAGEAGRRARGGAVNASPVTPPTGPWYRLVVRQQGRRGFVWSLRYSPVRNTVVVDRMDAAPPFWIPVPAELSPLIARATAGLVPHRGQ